MFYDVKESGERVRQLRIHSGYTQETTAQKLNIDRSFLSHIEAGKKGCSVDLLVQFSELFNVSLDYLILGRYFEIMDNTQLKTDIEKLIGQLIQFKASL